jgi:small subunit ribosomal protein S12
VVVRATIVTPRKPNSARRPVAKVKLSNKTRVTAHIPGVRHSLKRFNKLYVRGGGARDLPGVRYSCIRGVKDCLSVKGKTKRRSIYGISIDKALRPHIRRKYRLKLKLK